MTESEKRFSEAVGLIQCIFRRIHENRLDLVKNDDKYMGEADNGSGSCQDITEEDQ